jgi:hypothetical protein
MSRSFAAQVVLILMVQVLPCLTTPAVAQARDPFCPAGSQSRFVLGIAALHDHLGTIMGEPVECEHVDPASGDTIQHTTTGLAYYRPAINTAVFTNGEAHWALSNDALVLWRSASVVPPRPTPGESAYLEVTRPVVDRINALQDRLAQLRGRADLGQLDEIDLAEISDLIGELTRTRQAFAAGDESGRLAEYDGLMLRSLDEALATAGQLLRARMTDLPEARDAFVAEAGDHLAASRHLERSAQDAYSRALPIVVG